VYDDEDCNATPEQMSQSSSASVNSKAGPNQHYWQAYEKEVSISITLDWGESTHLNIRHK